MRILLIQSYLGRKEPPVAPLGLAVLAASLKPHDISITDPNILPHPLEDTLKIINELAPDVIGVSLRNIDTTKYSDQFLYYNHFERFIESIAGVKNDSVLVLGGSGFTLFPEQIMRNNPAADFGIVQEADVTFKTFLDNDFNPHAAGGVYYRDSGIRFSGSPEIPEPETLETPRWDLIDLSRYAPYAAKAAIGIEAKRGCAMRCSYCTYPNLSSGKLRLKSAAKVVDEIEYLTALYPVEKVFFTDPVFNYPLEHAESICIEIIGRGLKINWGGYHQDRYFTKKYMETAIESGCNDFYFSPDAATPESLKCLNKSTTIDSLNKSLDLIKSDIRAKTAYNFFAAVPEGSWKNILSALKFLLKAKITLGRRLERYKLSYIRIEPNTEMANKSGGETEANLLPCSYKELDKMFYRRTGSKLLDILLKLHYNIGKHFGSKNTF